MLMNEWDVKQNFLSRLCTCSNTCVICYKRKWKTFVMVSVVVSSKWTKITYYFVSLFYLEQLKDTSGENAFQLDTK